jgi:hypothetical protein
MTLQLARDATIERKPLSYEEYIPRRPTLQTWIATEEWY